MPINEISCDAASARHRISGFDNVDPPREDTLGASLTVHQVRAGRLRRSVTRVAFGPLTFDAHRYSLPVHLRRKTDRDVVTFATMGQAAVCGSVPVAACSVVLIPANSEFETYTKAAFRYFAIALRHEELVEHAKSVGLSFDFERLSQFARLAGPSEFERKLAYDGESMERDCRSGSFSPGNGDSVRIRELMTSLCQVLAASQSQDGSTTLVARQARLVRSAGKYLERCRTSETTVELLCDVLGVPHRTLQQAFHAIVGVGPCRYARMLRLHFARRALSSGAMMSRSVTDVGLSCGFEHLGRFSKYYRDFFGESPSETLRRNSGRRLLIASIE